MSKKAIITLFCAALLLVSFSQIACIISGYVHADMEFAKLSEIAHTEEAPIDPSVPAATTDSDGAILPQYQALYEENPDLAGWIQIEGTRLNYPVMYTPNDPEFYLYRAFDRSNSSSGTPFIGQGCSLDPRSGNVILYGHNMKDKSMFASLLKYKDKQFWQTHPRIKFDTLFKTGEYEVLSAFYVDVTPQNGHFAFYDIDTADEQQAFVEKCKQLSLYDTGVSASSEDHFLTLVTCSYHSKNGRFVVVAREKTGEASSLSKRAVPENHN